MQTAKQIIDHCFKTAKMSETNEQTYLRAMKILAYQTWEESLNYQTDRLNKYNHPDKKQYIKNTFK